MSQIPVTVEGKRKLQEELFGLEQQVPKVQEAIAEARERGDLKENAEYHAAREKLGFTNGQIAELKSKLARSVVVDDSNIDKDRVAFGACVDLEDLSDNSNEEWFLVGEGEDDPLENKILTSSPMGQALLGFAVGDEITVEAPVGELRFKIKSIDYH
jgi:transcription elongation factor GreA